MTTEGNTFFSVDSRLLLQLGEKLVTNRAIALAELIKNSYDADATHVMVRIENIAKPGGTIVVEDNGTGMTLSTFERTWMRIATIDKEENPISERYKRQKSGDKGIGRFACRKLSSRLLLKSVAETESGNKEELNAVFDWAAFLAGYDVDKTPVRYSAKPVDYDALTGTTLTLENTSEPWESSDIRHLRIELMDLLSPTTFEPKTEFEETPREYDPGFQVDFESDEFPTTYEQLDTVFFKNAWAKLSGSVDDSGVATYEIQVINKILNKIEKTFKRAEAFKYLKNAKLEVYIFSYRSDLFGNSEWSLAKTRKTGEERGSVKVYADNFRVFGYGGEGDDWLRVDFDRARSLVRLDKEVGIYAKEDKRPGLRLFRNNNLFGHVVFVRNDNPMLEITVNRERLIDGEACGELKKFARLGIDFVTVLYANEITKEQKEQKERAKAAEEARGKAQEEATRKAEEARRKAEEEAQEAAQEREETEEEARRAEQERIAVEKERRAAEEESRKAEEDALKTNDAQAWQRARRAQTKVVALLKAEGEAREREEQAKKKAEEARRRAYEERAQADEERGKAEAEQRRAEEAELKKEREKYADEFLQLRVLASTGTLILIFEHELQALIEDMEEMTTNLSLILKTMPDNEQIKYNDALESFSNRTEMVKELGGFLGLTIGAESRLERKEWAIFPIIDSVFRPFRLYLKEFGIEYRNTVPDNLRTPMMYRSELVSVLHNLMTNAAKAVKGEQDRHIEVTGFEENGTVHIQFLDSGRGLDRSRWEEVFEPFETDSEPDLRFGVGTGLGLKLVRDMVRAYGGDVKFIEAPGDWKACVEITLPVEGMT